MPVVGPTSRNDLIYYFRKLGFQGPHPGTKHSIMVKGQLKVRIPNPHQGDISVGLLNRILKQAEIEKSVWEKL
ncbi:MAG TPA: type II toxin-antitoxin system HicA family toxin [Candidatus Kapabacteria bacterium]|nr:type II toxin-antitoxin system HicA family toxin [Candidatus Kapabacteria bacterium]